MYTTDPARGKEKRLVVTCRSGKATFTLDLADESKLAVVPPISPTGMRLPTVSKQLSIVAARWGVGLTWTDVTKEVSRKMTESSHYNDIRISGAESSGGVADPWRGVHKHVVIWFDYLGRRYVRVIRDDKTEPLLQ